MTAPAYTMICTIAINSRAEQQVEHGDRSHDADQRQRARDRMPLQHHVDGGHHRDRSRTGEKRTDPSLYVTYSGPERHQEAGDEQIQQRGGKQNLPGESHQLVITEAGQRRANPHENEKQETASWPGTRRAASEREPAAGKASGPPARRKPRRKPAACIDRTGAPGSGRDKCRSRRR